MDPSFQRKQLASHTVIDLVWLSPLLVDEDDGDENNDLSDNAEEWPKGGQLATHTQLNLIASWSYFIGTLALVHAHVLVDVQIIHVQRGLVGTVLDLILVNSAIDNGLLCVDNAKLLVCY